MKGEDTSQRQSGSQTMNTVSILIYTQTPINSPGSFHIPILLFAVTGVLEATAHPGEYF